MNPSRYIRHPVAIVSCCLLACLAAALICRGMKIAHKHARTHALTQAIKLTPEFSHVHVRPRDKTLDIEVNGSVETREQFSALTNLLSSFASDMSIGVGIEWPTGRDYNREPGGGVSTSIGSRGPYEKTCDTLWGAVFFTFACLLFVVLAAGFGGLWKIARVGEVRARDFTVLVITPFVNSALPFLIFGHLPHKGSEGHMWLFPFSFVCTVCLLTYCFRALVKGPYRLLASLGLITSTIAVIPECLGSAGMVAGRIIECLE